ncbi:MAG: hypothetical protein P8Y60_02500 [Calditrichota bacterium]
MIKYLSIILLLIGATFALADNSDTFTYKLPKYSYHKFSNGFELIMVENHTTI